jgi:uncharacterized tellurite resistance protein B-like protein
MSLFNFFKDEKKEEISQLQAKLDEQFHAIDDEVLSTCACYAGLFAKVAYSDFNISDEEISKMKKILAKLTHLNQDTTNLIVEIAVSDMKELSGIQDHFYTQGLTNKLSEKEKGDLLIALFALAAVDNNVEEAEVESIRNIATGLNLGRPHFVAAKARFVDFLASLK